MNGNDFLIRMLFAEQKCLINVLDVGAIGIEVIMLPMTSWSRPAMPEWSDSSPMLPAAKSSTVNMVRRTCFCRIS